MTFAQYILAQEDYLKKVQIVYVLAQRENIYFDKSVVFKTDLLQAVIECMELDVDENEMITASLLCACKKDDSPSWQEKLETYGTEGAEFLKTLGFSDRFCKICEGHNRYNTQTNREYESDILEVIDNFGGMLLYRTERPAYSVEDAIVLLESRNLKNKNNKFLDTFKEFVDIPGIIDAIKFLQKTANDVVKLT